MRTASGRTGKRETGFGIADRKRLSLNYHGAVHLAELQNGERAVVVGVAAGEAFCQLCSLGLNAGAEVEVVRTLSRKTLLVIRVDGSDIALRRETAATVRIAPASAVAKGKAATAAAATAAAAMVG